jgi:tetratricopeptide (TPR) repeat protein
MKRLRRFSSVVRLTLSALLVSVAALAQTPGQSEIPPAPGDDVVKQGQQLVREGKHEEGLALYQKALETNPESFRGNLQAGVVLDLLGRYADARKHIEKAIQVAPTPQARISASRAMAMSYAFERNCAGAQKYEAPLYEQYLKAEDFFMAGEIANELARVCLESGDLDAAETWYRNGYAAGPREPGIKPERKDLWDFRWEHAQARLAVRRGNTAEAKKHVEAAKATLDKGTNPDQAQYFPYLTGYVAFHSGDFQAAVAELQKANQDDPFILVLTAQAFEKLGDQAKATEYYQKALASNAHNPTGAYARPLAKKAVEKE